MELVLYATCILFAVSSLYVIRHFAGARRNLPPGPPSWPLIGNLLDLGAQPHRSLARLAERHGPLMTLRLGALTTVIASSADTARDVLQRHDAAFSARSVSDAARACAYDSLSMGWLPPSSPHWRALRKLCSGELFAPHRLDAHQSIRREKVQQLVSHVARLSREGAAVDVSRVVFTTALNLLSCTIFSADIADLDDREGTGQFRAVIASFTEVAGLPNLSDFFPAVAPLDPQRLRKRLAAVLKRLHAIFDEQIERRMRERTAGEPPKDDFLDVLLDYRGLENGRGLDREMLRALLSDLFIAGSDTSATTFEWAMAGLLQNPSAMAKAREELAQVIGSKSEIEESDIGQLEYIQAIVKEVFRLHPVAPFLIPRQAEATTELRGYTVPKGARVMVNVWAIGRDSELWSEPERFIPERFLGKDMDYRGRHFELLPFGSGRRICPGMPLAVRMVHLMLATLLYRFEWRLPREVEGNGVDMREKFGIVLALATPLQAIAEPM
ncbi:geraniol 8-hydroxylase-like [Triticum dicoccoides]|uniref:geraniol 8-hydroxylase-like n=1 Tax=Triticum dicoccoides TaxID=85692 RepID=UPI000E7C4FE7|nr:geraniol 8-hydroxylase-like [Triticum dicoccoides]